MKKFISLLAALGLMAFAVPLLAMEAPGNVDPAQAIMDVHNKVNNVAQGWALNKWKLNDGAGPEVSFTLADQPCYLTKLKSGSGFKRGCAIPEPDANSASAVQDVVWPSVRGSGSYDCLYKREVLLIVIPQMLDRLEAGAAYRPVLENLYAFAVAWKAAYPSLGNMKPGGTCVIDQSRTPVEYQIDLPAH